MSQLIKYAIANETTLGIAIRPHFQRRQPSKYNKKKEKKILMKIIIIKWFIQVPDSLLIPLLKERLGQLDCVSRGWVLHGFPRTRAQAESLERSGFSPNR